MSMLRGGRCRRHTPMLLLLILPLLILPLAALAAPLFTSGRWIVDAATGRRVKLRCVNWAAHMPPVLAEGLDKKPVHAIAGRIASLGFNCVRLTWATSLFTSSRFDNLTVAGSLSSLSLHAAAAGVLLNNPAMARSTVREAFDEVVNAIGGAGLMAVLDNHVSRPIWCCSNDDGNGFFGDEYFSPEEWLNGLVAVARRFRNFPQVMDLTCSSYELLAGLFDGEANSLQVVGMSMRNELRGRRQSVEEWYRYVTLGGNAVRESNPDLLVIVSGLSYDTDLRFLWSRPLGLRLEGKLVFEAHWYSFSERREWEALSPTRVCADVAARFDSHAGFLALGGRFPLFVSEFGVDQTGGDVADNRFLSCFLGFAADRDLDWALWALQGSYYWRNGVAGFEETYGVLDSNWEQPRNPIFQERFRLIQDVIQDPGSPAPAFQIIYHPQSGLCLHANGSVGVGLSDCRTRSRWRYTGDGAPIFLMGSPLCLRVSGDGLPVGLSTECGDQTSIWTVASGFHLAAVGAGGRRLCLQRNSPESSAVLTKDCLCLADPVCAGDPQAQWFRFVTSNRE